MDSIAVTIPESIHYDDYLVATYAYQTPANVRILDAVRAIAETQSCGTWVSVGKSSEVHPPAAPGAHRLTVGSTRLREQPAGRHHTSRLDLPGGLPNP